jgi:hypothetical protein
MIYIHIYNSSDDSKVQAKTIDLCNNPLHKESKVDMAKRVISGIYMYVYIYIYMCMYI